LQLEDVGVTGKIDLTVVERGGKAETLAEAVWLLLIDCRRHTADFATFLFRNLHNKT